MSTLALSPVSAGVFAALNVAAITDLATGGISDLEVPTDAGWPRVWFTVSEENARGLGRGGLRKMNLRVFAADRSSSEADGTEGVRRLQLLMAQIVYRLEDFELSMDGYRIADSVFYSDTLDPYDEVIAGVPCKESAANFYFWVEPTAESPFVALDWIQ